MKRQLMNWEKILANHTCDRRLIPQIHKELILLNSMKTNNPILKWAKDMKRHFSKDIQMAGKSMKKHLTCLIRRQLQIKATIKYYLTPVSIVIIKKTDTKY